MNPSPSHMFLFGSPEERDGLGTSLFLHLFINEKKKKKWVTFQTPQPRSKRKIPTKIQVQLSHFLRPNQLNLQMLAPYDQDSRTTCSDLSDCSKGCVMY